MRIGLIGHGAIGSEISRLLSGDPAIEVAGALVLDADLGRGADFPLTTSLAEFAALGPELVVECAGHAAVASHVTQLLAAGTDCVVISIGALADDALCRKLVAAAARGGARIFLPPGAMLGIDGLAAAALAGLDRVRLTSTKPPMAWAGAPGVEGVALGAITTATPIFEGTARAAALAFPKNANIAATVALAGIGLDKTEVRLIADPGAAGNHHLLEFEGAAGSYKVEALGKPSPLNPKTSRLTALNILRVLRRQTDAIVI